MPPRVRFAPSPTGYLHVGGARTALFNWLFARKTGGVFVLRIEDTDAGRSSAEMVAGILDGLRWLGLDWDEGPLIGGGHGPYFQSERFGRHREAAARLVSEGKAYYCYCTPEEITAKREAAERAGRAWTYDRTCLGLSPSEIAVRERTGQPRAIRFRVPDGWSEAFDDLVHGTIRFDAAHIEDFVIVRSDGHPTYHLSVVCDDVDMAISHVVRGDDHVSNTPKHILLYQAIGAPVPRFAHVPLIFGPDKKRLSKRHGATSVMEYAAHGYLPEAMVNFLALLGWSPGAGDRELFSRAELVDAFALEGISGGNAVFNVEKLDWFNQQHIMRLAPSDLAERIKPALVDAGLWRDEYLGERHAWFFAVVELLRSRAKRLGDFAVQGRFFFTDDIQYDEAAVAKYFVPEMGTALEAIRSAFAGLEVFDAASTETALRRVAEAGTWKAGMLIHTVRAAVTGRTVSPGLFDVLALVGRQAVDRRLTAAVAFIRAGAGA